MIKSKSHDAKSLSTMAIAEADDKTYYDYNDPLFERGILVIDDYTTLQP
jgi:hypothetical protein